MIIRIFNSMKKDTETIKKDQSPKKGCSILNKKYTGRNTVGQMKQRIKSAIWKTRYKKTPKHSSKKKNN